MWKCRYAPSLGPLEETPQKIWGTMPYREGLHAASPTVFFGLYGLNDFNTLWRHEGPRAVLWAGSDIIHFMNGYWLDTEGKIRVNPRPLAKWLNTYCENWVENHVERYALQGFGINSKMCPSFLGDVNLPVSYKWNKRPKLYASVSGDNFVMYGWDKIMVLADQFPDIEFHLYGNIKPWTETKNVIVHGRVPKEQMNEEIKEMQGGIRLTEFDGFSEIIAKSVLMGQWPVSLIEYPYVLNLNQITEIHNKKKPNLEGRKYYQNNLNKFPWNQK